MRCYQVQAKVNDLPLGSEGTELDRDVREHIAGCSACARLEKTRKSIEHDLEELSFEATQEPLAFHQLRHDVYTQIDREASMNQPKSSVFRTFLASPRRVGLSAALVVVVAIVAALLPFSSDDIAGYEITVSGVDESLLASGAIGQLFAAVGLSDAGIEMLGCTPLCEFRVTGLTTLIDAQLAVAAIQAVPDAVIHSVDRFTDQRTGISVSRTTSTSQLTVSEDQWTLELGIDSSIYKRISVALDSLKQDTTVAWTQWFQYDEGPVAGVQKEYTVHPDGSYSNSIFANPKVQAQLGWSKQTWTFDSLGVYVAYTIIDTLGVEHDIDIRNWVVQEEQLRQVGTYHMITYDDTGTPCHTATNVDPAELPGYGPHLAPGMYLNQNQPNPFDTLTHITFGLPETSSVKLVIYNGNSELVRTLIDSVMAPGDHTVTWNSRSDQGKRVWSQIYLCKLEVGEYYHTITMSQVW